MLRKITCIICLSTLSFLGLAQNTTQQAYVEQYKSIAISEMLRTGIPASITLAQGILESASGNSKLAMEANNHFGIKCHADWHGQTIEHDDDLQNECFRKYASPEESFYDHSEFIRKGSRYASLFELKTSDYKRWARGLQQAGYATNRKYADKLIEIIERYNLQQYDKTDGAATVVADVPTAKPVTIQANTQKPLQLSVGKHQVGMLNRVSYVVARQGDTYAALTAEFDKMRWELEKYNDVPQGIEPEAGQVVYLQPKRNKASREHRTHIVQQGESMWSISQKYAVKLNALYKKNRMTPGDEPETGQKIWLRKKIPASKY